jgi:hypothetical protein
MHNSLTITLGSVLGTSSPESRFLPMLTLCRNRYAKTEPRQSVADRRNTVCGNNTIDFDFPRALPIASLLLAVTTKTTLHSLTNSIIDEAPNRDAFTTTGPPRWGMIIKWDWDSSHNDGVAPQTIPDYSTDLYRIGFSFPLLSGSFVQDLH